MPVRGKGRALFPLTTPSFSEGFAVLRLCLPSRRRDARSDDAAAEQRTHTLRKRLVCRRCGLRRPELDLIWDGE